MIRKLTSLAIALVLSMGDSLPQVNAQFEDCSGDYSFIPIASTGTRLETVSNCDDCFQSIMLPFAFPWTNMQSYTEIGIGSNGALSLPSIEVPFEVLPIGGTGSKSIPRISVAQGDLDPGDAQDHAVYRQDNLIRPGSVTFSFENASFEAWGECGINEWPSDYF